MKFIYTSLFQYIDIELHDTRTRPFQEIIYPVKHILNPLISICSCYSTQCDFVSGVLSQGNGQVEDGGHPFDPNKLMHQFMQMRTDQNAFGSYNPMDVKEAAKAYFQKTNPQGNGPPAVNFIAALSGFDPNGQSMFAGHQSEIWKFSSHYNPNENIHKYVSESTDVGSLGRIDTPDAGLNQGITSGESHPNNHFNANALNSNLMTVIDKHKFRPGEGTPSTFSSPTGSVSMPGPATSQMSGTPNMEAGFNPNHLNHELFQNLGYNPEAINSETVLPHTNPMTLLGQGNTQDVHNGASGNTGSTQSIGVVTNGKMSQDGGTTTHNQGTETQNSGHTLNQDGGSGAQTGVQNSGTGTNEVQNGGTHNSGNIMTGIQNGGISTQNGGNIMTGTGGSTIQNGGINTQNGGKGTENGGTTHNGNVGIQNGGTVTQIGGATNQNGGTGVQTGGATTQNGGTGSQTGGATAQNGGTVTQNGNSATGNGGNTGQSTGSNTQTSNQPQYHIVLNSKGEHVLVQSTDTKGKFIVIKTISNEKLANYLIGKLSSSTSNGSPIPKSLSAFISDHSKEESALPMVEGSHFNMNTNGYHAVHENVPSQQVGAYGTQAITANGIGELGGEQVGQIPSVYGSESLGKGSQPSRPIVENGNIHQVNTNPYVHVTGIGTLGGSNSDSQLQVPGLESGTNTQATGIGSLGGDDSGNDGKHTQFTGMVKPVGIGSLGKSSLKRANIK